MTRNLQLTFSLRPALLSLGLLLAGGAAVTLSAPVEALAQATTAKARVDAAKAEGLVGEQADGFLGFVQPSKDAALLSAVTEINAGRAQLYREAAARTGADPAAAGEAAFRTTVFERIKAGEYYRNSEGRWVRK
ncbi:MAG: YdbL family protein [Asticcacaulis sp.]